MSIFFDNSDITIYRQRRIGSTNRYAMSATFTTYNADIQPAGRDRLEMVDGRFGKTYVAFVDDIVDIKEGDQVVTADSKKYSVKGVSIWTGAGLLSHKELILVALD